MLRWSGITTLRSPRGGAVPLTTIRSPMHEMGRLGVRLLLEVLAGRSPESVVLEPELIIRGSSMIS